MPTWDSEKGAGDGLSSEQWNNHVDDQKSRAKNIVQEEEPDVGAVGDMWTQPTQALDRINTFDTGSSDEIFAGDRFVIHIQSNGFDVYDFETGESQWSISYLDDDPIGFDVTDQYLFTAENSADYPDAYLFDKSTGDQIWSNSYHSAQYEFIEGVAATSDRVYINHENESEGYDAEVLAADISDGSVIWTHNEHTSGPASIVADNSLVVSSTDSGSTIGADADGGDKIWEYGRTLDGLHLDGEKVYAHSGSTVYAIDRIDGSVVWEHDHHINSINDITLDSDRVVSTSDEMVISANIDDGSLIADFEVPDGENSSVIDVDSNVFTSTSAKTSELDDTEEYVLRISNGDIWMNQS